MRRRHRGVDDLALENFEPGAKMRVLAQCAEPVIGERQHKGSVALASAKVDVRGTTPGMLATQ